MKLSDLYVISKFWGSKGSDLFDFTVIKLRLNRKKCI